MAQQKAGKLLETTPVAVKIRLAEAAAAAFTKVCFLSPCLFFMCALVCHLYLFIRA
jgi:hypothetical protein